MRKEKYDKLDKNKKIICRCCGRELLLKDFAYSCVRTSDFTGSRCATCDWVYRHNGLPKIDSYKDDTIYSILDNILLNNIVYLNELCNIAKLSLDEIISIICKLKIGNRSLSVKYNCKYCGKEYSKVLSAYIKQSKQNMYCSYQCYWNDKPNTVGYGENNICYNRITTECTNCGKKINIIPYDYNTTNQYGDSHHFCSQQCYWQYRSKYYVGKKSISANRIFTKEQKEKMKLRILKNSRSSKRFDSKIQLSINKILDDNQIKYIREYIVGYYAVDNYLVDNNLIIEVMGDYWHTSPLIYNENQYKINETQRRGIQKDKQKYSYIKNNLNIEILYLWEYDIDNRPDLCKDLIQLYISENGILNNYHSFNWSFDETNRLVINHNIILPYQQQNIEDYRKLFKPKVV